MCLYVFVCVSCRWERRNGKETPVAKQLDSTDSDVNYCTSLSLSSSISAIEWTVEYDNYYSEYAFTHPKNGSVWFW